jgi:hypothetical protein
MLAPFVLNLLISCSLLLLVAWTGDVISTWVGIARRTDSHESQRTVERGRRIDHAVLTACTPSGTSGEWLLKFDRSERN